MHIPVVLIYLILIGFSFGAAVYPNVAGYITAALMGSTAVMMLISGNWPLDAWFAVGRYEIRDDEPPRADS